MKTRESKSWILFIVAFIVACMIWYMVVSRENPKVNISLGNVAVTIRGGNTLHDKGYAYFIEDYDYIGVEADVAQKKAVLVSSEDFLLNADVSECTEGENTVPVDVKVKSNRSIIGNNYTLKHDSITVRLEKLVEKEIPVQIDVTGKAADGLSAGDAQSESDTIMVKLPESMESEEFTARVSADITDAKENVSASAAITILDKDGNEVNTTELQIIMEQDTVDVMVPVGVMKSVTISLPGKSEYLVSGKYCSKISANLDSVDLIGPEKTVEGLTKIKITASDLALNKAEESYTKEINLEEYLPEGVYIRQKSDIDLEVKVTIGKMTKKTYKLTSDNVIISGGKKSDVTIVTGSFQVTIGSSQEVIDELSADDINATLDITLLGDGSHTLTPVISYDNVDDEDRIELYSAGKITITVSGS